jgi:uroporphyrinogen-III synthase
MRKSNKPPNQGHRAPTKPSQVKTRVTKKGINVFDAENKMWVTFTSPTKMKRFFARLKAQALVNLTGAAITGLTDEKRKLVDNLTAANNLPD